MAVTAYIKDYLWEIWAGIPPKALAAVLLALGLQFLFWQQTHGVRNVWAGVPPAPSLEVARALALGDGQFFYRAATFALQNMGDEGGRMTPLRNYDYQRLGQWFRLLDELDPDSDFLPVLVGYYYSQSQNSEHLGVVIDYLAGLGERDPGKNWRWMAHAIYLARHRLDDIKLALDLAYRMAALKGKDVPIWAKQMPAFVLAEVGEAEAARDLIAVILESEPNLSPDEVTYMEEFIIRFGGQAQ